MILLVPLRWLLAIVSAAVVHELFHIIALYLSSVPIIGITIGSGGAVISTDAMSRRTEMICAAAGPLGSFLLLILFGRCLPRLALCAGIQGLSNLIPVLPFDGGRMVYCFVCLLANEKAGKWVLGILGGMLLLFAFRVLIRIPAFILFALPWILKNTLQRCGSESTIGIHVVNEVNL